MRRYQELALPDMSGRFVSEFGMEAYPHLSTITSHIATQYGQQYPGSMTMDYHNRAIDHERRLTTYMAENFKLQYDLASFAHISQVIQSDAVTFAYRSWRREWGAPSRRKCGGVLVWQFNDTWPTMSWAVVDYFLVKKPSFYAIKRALKPVVVGVSRPFHEWTSGHCDPTVASQDKTYDVWVSNLGAQDVEVDVIVRAVSIKTGQDLVKPVIRKALRAHATGTTEIMQNVEVCLDGSGKPAPQSEWDPYIVHASLTRNGKLISTDTAWPHPIKYLDFPDRGVKVTLSSEKDTLTITAGRPVHGFVFEEKKDWVSLSDNGFDVVPGEEVVVQTTGGEVKEEDIRWTYIGAEQSFGLKDTAVV
jgi:beta-mannosidase